VSASNSSIYCEAATKSWDPPSADSSSNIELRILLKQMNRYDAQFTSNPPTTSEPSGCRCFHEEELLQGEGRKELGSSIARKMLDTTKNALLSIYFILDISS
jgi:hypothetical protein